MPWIGPVGVAQKQGPPGMPDAIGQAPKLVAHEICAAAELDAATANISPRLVMKHFMGRTSITALVGH